MKVGIIICVNCMTCMFAVALTLGESIKREASQSEKTFPIGGNVTLLCPLVTDDTLEWIYWKKNDRTIYSRNINFQTTTTNDTKYEGITYATRLTIKDLKKADSGIYYCKVSTTFNIEEGGHVMIYVTDQEGGLFTTSPGFPVRASTTMPPKPPEDNTFYSAFLITLSILLLLIIIIIITMCLVFKYRKQIAESRLVKDCQRLQPSQAKISDQADIPLRAKGSRPATSRLDVSGSPDPNSSLTPLIDRRGNLEVLAGEGPEASTMTNRTPVPAASTPMPAAPNHENVKQGIQANISDQPDMPSRAQGSRNTTFGRLYASAPNDTNIRSSPLPYSSAHASESGETQLPLIGQLLIDDLLYASTSNAHLLVVTRMRQLLHSLVNIYAREKKGYSASLKKYVKRVPVRILDDVEYVLEKLDHIPVGLKRDVCEILLTMPENQEKDKSKSCSNMDIFLVYGQKNQEYADNDALKSMAETLRSRMRSILKTSKTRDAARNEISRTILYAASRNNQSANKTEQEPSIQSQRDEDSDLEDDNLIRFWLSKVMKLDPTVQAIVIEKFDQLELDAHSSSMEQPLDDTDMQHDDAKEVKKTASNESADQRPESRVPTSDDQVSAKPDRLKDEIVGPKIDNINKKSIETPGEKDMG